MMKETIRLTLTDILDQMKNLKETDEIPLNAQQILDANFLNDIGLIVLMSCMMLFLAFWFRRACKRCDVNDSVGSDEATVNTITCILILPVLLVLGVCNVNTARSAVAIKYAPRVQAIKILEDELKHFQRMELR